MYPDNNTKTPQTMEEKMDEVILHLKRIDARDRMRMWGGTVKTFIALIPIVLLLWSSWYLVEHGADLMKQIANIAASSAAEYTTGQSKGFVDDLMQKYQFPKQ